MIQSNPCCLTIKLNCLVEDNLDNIKNFNKKGLVLRKEFLILEEIHLITLL